MSSILFVSFVIHIFNQTPSQASMPTTPKPSTSQVAPTSDPTSYGQSFVPTTIPTYLPSFVPTTNPTNVPTIDPTSVPTINPTQIPTNIPTINPTIVPTSTPTADSIHLATSVPTTNPTNNPTQMPTTNPSTNPTSNPTNIPTTNPTIHPTNLPTYLPSFVPTTNPTYLPSFVHTNASPSPTSSPVVKTFTHITANEDGTWSDDYKLYDDPNIWGWSMNKSIITNGTLHTYYGPWNTNGTEHPLYVLFDLFRTFSCASAEQNDTFNVVLQFSEVHIGTSTADYITVQYANDTQSMDFESLGSGIYYVTDHQNSINDSVLNNIVNNTWFTSISPYYYGQRDAYVSANELYVIKFSVRVSEVTSYIGLYDITIQCVTSGTQYPTYSPTFIPSYHPNPHSPSSNPSYILQAVDNYTSTFYNLETTASTTEPINSDENYKGINNNYIIIAASALLCLTLCLCAFCFLLQAIRKHKQTEMAHNAMRKGIQIINRDIRQVQVSPVSPSVNSNVSSENIYKNAYDINENEMAETPGAVIQVTPIVNNVQNGAGELGETYHQNISAANDDQKMKQTLGNEDEICNLGIDEFIIE